MTKKILRAASLRDWDTPETKAVYWSGACYALIAATNLYGCKRGTIRDTIVKAHTEAYDRLYADGRRAGASLDCDWNRLSPEQRAWYSMGAADALTDVLDALPDVVIDHCPTGFRTLRRARQAWIDKNQALGDDYARKAGLLK
nr:MAG TPA: hypothetical protein [Caudoviricetes sp.]